MIKTRLGRAMIGPIAYVSGALVALASAPAAFAIYTSVAVYYAASRRRSRISGRQKAASIVSSELGSER